MRHFKFFLCLGLLGLFTASCAELQSLLVTETVSALKACEFRITGIEHLRLAGVDLASLRKPTQITVPQGLKLAQALSQRNLATEFTLNLGMRNPNSGGGGTKQTPATLTQMPWRLLLQGKETISGTLRQPVAMGDTGREVTVPLDIRLNLAEFFGGESMKNLLDLAFAIGGASRTPATVSLLARPKLETPLGPIEMPNEIQIVEQSY